MDDALSLDPPAIVKKPTGKPKTFNCPSCAGTVTIKAVGITLHAVCSQCSSLIDVSNDAYHIITTAHQKTRKTFLDTGMRGRLQGIDWEVIGYMQKKDGSGIYRWEEYLLYNPYYGFRFLVYADGHWNFVKIIKQDIDITATLLAKKLWLENKEYALFHTGQAVVQYVKGEFYWRVKQGDTAEIIDYIAPPYMVSVEKGDQDITLSLCEYTESEIIKEAFNLAVDMPLKDNIAANQPPPYHGSLWKIWAIGMAAFIVAFIVHTLTMGSADNEIVYEAQANINPYQKNQTITSPSFTMLKEGNILIESASPVQNEWLELSISLVNELTEEEYQVHHAIEYYHGYEGGEHWSEGAQQAESYLSAVSHGDYRLLIDVDSGAFQKQTPVTFSIRVTRDVPVYSNFWLTALLVMIYPFFTIIRRWNVEGKRWSQSDYAPLIYRSSEEGNWE